MTWHVYTDGSAISDETMRENGKARYPGGWAAVIEHGSDGYVIRGRQADTTNTRMELRAMIEGLAQVPDGERAVLHTDCTISTTVRQRWLAGHLGQSVDLEWWKELVAQYERVDVDVRLIGRGPNPVHARAHAIAQTEAKAQRHGLPVNATVLSKIEKKERRRAAMLDQARADDIRRRKQIADFRGRRIEAALRQVGLQHARDCVPGRCVVSCPVWLNFGVR